MIITLEGERPWSWNKFYSGIHWTKRKEEADRIHLLVITEIKESGWLSGALPPGRFDIHTTVYFKNKPQDSDNICDKFYIDGLIGTVLVDDDRRYVRKTTTQSEIDRKNPRVEIAIKAVKE